MKRTRIMAVMLTFILCISLLGCGSKKSITEGTYVAQDVEGSYCPAITIFEKNTFQFNFGMGNYYKGTYTVKDDTVTFTMTENCSSLADASLEEITFTKDDDKDELVMEDGIDGFVEDGTVFTM